MQRLAFLEEQASTDATRDAYLEFNFFDGVMVDCNHRDGSDQLKSGHARFSSSGAYGNVDTVCEKGMEDASYCSTGDQPLPESTLQTLTDSKGSTMACMSSLGIHMCDCPDGSVHCNLSTPLGGRSRPMKQSTGWSLQKDLPSSPLRKPYYLHDNHIGQSPSPSHEGHLYYGRRSGNGCVAKSPLSVWAAVVSDSCSCSPIPTAGSSQTRNHKEGLRFCNQYGEQLPTLASRLELTGAALVQCKSDSSYGGCAVRDSAMPPSPLQRDLMKLKLDPKTISVTEPAPYGTLHGILHCNFIEGLPNYTFLLDDYDEVITAKLWMEDMMLGSEHGAWRYSFYSLRGKTRRKGKSGWKHWSRKEKLTSILVAKMKVASVLCEDEKQEMLVKSECILYTTRPKDLKQVGCSTQTSSSSSETDSSSCNSPSMTPMAGANVPSTIFSTSATDSPGHRLQAFMSLSSLAGAETPHKTQRWSLWSRIPHIQMTKNGKALKTHGANAHSKQYLTNDLVWSHLRQSEIAAIIMDVPVEVKDRQTHVHEQQRQASIKVILPSGNHGGPLSDVNGPSPLISRWKEGGRCDCKGWDLGCGLTILTNSWQKADAGSKTVRVKEAERGDEGEPLKLYKQDADHQDFLLSIAPKANGLVALEYRAPLSPLQAFAIAVAILHGRNSKVPKTQLQGVIGSYLHYGPPKDEDGLFVDDGPAKSKEAPYMDVAGLMVHRPFVNIGQAPELAHSLERV